MKRSDKYRFTLQWGAETDEKISAGEFLEKLGNRKSEFVVRAVTEYLNAHPEALIAGHRPHLAVSPPSSSEQLRVIVRDLISEHLAQTTRTEAIACPETPGMSNSDLDEMLSNLELFNET